MNRRLSFVIAFSLLALGATIVAQGFNVQTGTWQFTSQMNGALPVEGVPPAMRAQLEAELKKPKTFNSCVTAQDLKSLNLGKTGDNDDDKDCKTTSLKVTATTGDIVRECKGDEPRTDTMHFEASSPQAMKANISSKRAQGTMTILLTGKWVSAQCKN